ncbi:MAG: lysophospholipid acyltransferase family protein [Yoonia sp.]|uniref:lysophospholipid acyltransferase family protein n=1 Tax=Yoonia sp. TaxID=2212373 RepID=UPI00273D59E6|nr:lysophospholipid acyltransferase family protein [Yoonia sp.]MDP5085486.1 lysophospholipid acyltransferase family protein [Yoonia sp.]MDP5360431.1 lysophospholipid acyltransferase family protein [Paracoccaceae bacterium]
MPATERQVARDITYASAAKGRGGRAMIRVLENATGRLRLIRKAKGYDLDVAAGHDFWKVISERYGLELQVIGGTLDTIPTTGPLIVVSNHPYGILDGLMMGRILSERRQGDFRVLAHRIFRRAADLERVILPISFDDTKEAAKLNLETRAEAVRYLQAGGAIGIFPGGTVSTSATPFSQPMDPGWRTFTAKMIAKSEATVVPVFFEGCNSRLFQLASHIHSTLRTGMFIREFKTKINKPVRVVIGEPIPAAQLEAFKKDPKGCMDFLRKATYELSPSPLDASHLGHEFEAKYKVRNGRRYIR